jgi:hypothetical protein
MIITVIMATRRWQNWPKVRANIEAARSPAAEIRWRPVVYEAEWAEIPADYQACLQGDWIDPMVIVPTDYNPILHKCNAALEHLIGSGQDTWCFFGADDNLIPNSLGRKLSAAAEPGVKVIVSGLQRGQRAIHSGYPTFSLHAEPGNMRVCAVSGEQATIHISAFGELRFANSMCADGMMIQSLHERMPGAFRYLPDFYVPFNALEPERWDEDKLRALIEG